MIFRSLSNALHGLLDLRFAQATDAKIMSCWSAGSATVTIMDTVGKIFVSHAHLKLRQTPKTLTACPAIARSEPRGITTVSTSNFGNLGRTYQMHRRILA